MTTDRYDQALAALALLEWSASLDEIRVSFEEFEQGEGRGVQAVNTTTEGVTEWLS